MRWPTNEFFGLFFYKNDSTGFFIKDHEQGLSLESGYCYIINKRALCAGLFSRRSTKRPLDKKKEAI